MVRGRARPRPGGERGHRRGRCRDRKRRPRLRRHARPRPDGRRPGASPPHLPRAGAHVEGPRQRDHGAQGGAVRAQLRDRGDPHRRLDRHRGRRRNALLLLLQGPPRAAQFPNPDRRRDGAAVQGRKLRRPARLHLASRRRSPHQRLQLPDLGNAREVRADPARRSPRDRQTRLLHRLSRRGGVPDHDRGGCASARCPAAGDGRCRRPVRSSDASGRGQLHRLGPDRDEAPDPSGHRPRKRPLHRRARQPQRLDPRPRTRRPGLRNSTCSSRKWRAR